MYVCTLVHSYETFSVDRVFDDASTLKEVHLLQRSCVTTVLHLHPSRDNLVYRRLSSQRLPCPLPRPPVPTLSPNAGYVTCWRMYSCCCHNNYRYKVDENWSQLFNTSGKNYTNSAQDWVIIAHHFHPKMHQYPFVVGKLTSLRFPNMCITTP